MNTNWLLTCRSLLLTLVLHAALGVVLFFGFDFSTPPPALKSKNVNIVNAVSVDKQQVEAELKRLKTADDKKKSAAAAEKKALEQLKKQKQQEQKAINKLKKQREQEEKKKQAAAKKRQADEARLKQLKKEQEALEQKRKAKAETARKRKEAEEKAKAEAARKRKEAEEKAKAAALKKQQAAQKAREQALQDALAAEQKAQQQAADNQQIARYTAAIKRAISDEFKITNLPKGLSCGILIRILDGGQVAEVVITESSGNALFDKRAENAVYAASPLPAPDEARLLEKMRTIKLTFRP